MHPSLANNRSPESTSLPNHFVLFVRILPHRVEKLQHGLETAVLRGEVSTVRELAYLRSCVERIEDHLKLRLDELGIQKRH